MLGLGSDSNNLVASDASWPIDFSNERRRIAAVLGGWAVAIEHYGSTAVDGLRAKPIIDILVGMDRLECWPLCQVPLEWLGYRYFGEAEVEGHRIFCRGRQEGTRSHLLHLVGIDSPQWRLNLAFRDRLRADAALRGQYQRVKERAAQEAPYDRRRYNRLKSGFIVSVMGEIGLDRVPPSSSVAAEHRLDRLLDDMVGVLPV